MGCFGPRRDALSAAVRVRAAVAGSCDWALDGRQSTIAAMIATTAPPPRRTSFRIWVTEECRGVRERGKHKHASQPHNPLSDIELKPSVVVGDRRWNDEGVL